MPSALTISPSATAERMMMPTRVRMSTAPMIRQIAPEKARMKRRYTGYWLPSKGIDPVSSAGVGTWSV